MNKILTYLVDKNFEVGPEKMLVNDDKSISHIYTKKDDLYFCIVEPHEGNDYKFLLRANPIKTFDRWSVCDYEKKFDNSQELINYLEYSMVKIYQEILDWYIEGE